jgi:hypothetical protein
MKTNRRENYLLYPSIILILLMFSKIGQFAEEATHISGLIVRGVITEQKFFISTYRQLFYNKLDSACCYVVRCIGSNRQKNPIQSRDM